MALGTCDYCGEGYEMPTATSVFRWLPWWLCQACAREERGAE